MIQTLITYLEQVAADPPNDPDCDFIEAVVTFICNNGTPEQCQRARELCEEIGCDCPPT